MHGLGYDIFEAYTNSICLVTNQSIGAEQYTGE